MRTAMRLAHDGYNGNLGWYFTHEGFRTMRRDCKTNAASRPNWTGLQFWKQGLLVLVRDGAYDIHQTWDAPIGEFFAHLGPQLIERDRLAGLMGLDEFCRDARSDSQEFLGLRGSLIMIFVRVGLEVWWI
jgi:hypothetical protein